MEYALLLQREASLNLTRWGKGKRDHPHPYTKGQGSTNTLITLLKLTFYLRWSEG